MCFCAAWSRKSRWTNLNYSRRIKTANTSPHWPALCKLQSTQLFLKLCAIPFVCWILPPRFSNWLTPLFNFTVIHKYHPQHWERDGTPAQSGCDSGEFFLDPLCWCFIVTHTTHNTHKNNKDLAHNDEAHLDGQWCHNDQRPEHIFSNYLDISRTNVRKATRTERVQVHRRSLRQPRSLLVQRSGCSVNVHLTCE